MQSSWLVWLVFLKQNETVLLFFSHKQSPGPHFEKFPAIYKWERDRYVHAACSGLHSKNCTSCQSNESSFTLNNNKGRPNKKWVRMKGQKLKKVASNRKITTLISPLPPRTHRTQPDPSITETSSILPHIMEAVRPVKNIHVHTHTHTLPTINTSPPLPCTLSATCLSLAASEHRKTWHVPAQSFPLILPQILTRGMIHLSLSRWKTCSVLVSLAS